MTLLWLTLLLLHQGYTLVPVVTVELGRSVTLTCNFSMKYQSNTWLYWYKQNAGDTLNLILIQQRRTIPIYGPQFSASRFSVTSSEDRSSLTIIAAIQQDEGMYHCAQRDTLESTWSGIYLSIKGNSKNTTSYSVLQQPTISFETHPANVETLQCSVLADSENTTCSEEPSVFWFRARSDKSFPDVIYIGGKRSENCEKRSDSRKTCFYNFSKNVSSSDERTHYCAVATCGQILFESEKPIDIQGKGNKIKLLVVTVVAIICLVISVIGNIVFFCFQTQRLVCQQFKESSSSQNRKNSNQKRNDTEDGPDLNYAALHFSEGRTSKGKTRREFRTEESVYSHVKGSV